MKSKDEEIIDLIFKKLKLYKNLNPSITRNDVKKFINFLINEKDYHN